MNPLTRHHWPDSLDEVLAEPIERHCPSACVFSELCPTSIQRGIATLFQDGSYNGPSDCLWYERLMGKVKTELGDGPVPTTAWELRLRMKTIRGMP